jgi:hypothetical protein
MSKTVSRRAILAGASAATVPIPALASASTIAGPDAELLALGVQLTKVEREIDALDTAVKAGAEISDAEGYTFCDRLCDLTSDILARKAHSVDGLAVQTRAITLAAADLWELDDESHERTFIEAVCRFVGLSIPSATVRAS